MDAGVDGLVCDGWLIGVGFAGAGAGVCAHLDELMEYYII